MIVRSTGIKPVIKGHTAPEYPWPGGGMEGATKQLDTAVMKAAAALKKAFGGNVEVRFNADQRSGGAWLKTKPYGSFPTDQNARVGICYRLPHYKCEGPGGKGRGCHCTGGSCKEYVVLVDGVADSTKVYCGYCIDRVRAIGPKGLSYRVSANRISPSELLVDKECCQNLELAVPRAKRTTGNLFEVNGMNVVAMIGWIKRYVKTEHLDPKTR